jgi:lysophospholipase L1-like esterase
MRGDLSHRHVPGPERKDRGSSEGSVLKETLTFGTLLKLGLAVAAAVLAARIVLIVARAKFDPAHFFLQDVANDVGRSVFLLVLCLLVLAMLRWGPSWSVLVARGRGWLGNALLVLLSLTVTLLVFELAMRPFSVVFTAGHATRNVFGEKGNRSGFRGDQELGFMPVMGEGREYTLYGTRRAGHPVYPVERRPGWQRVVMLGDSIAAIGYTQIALEERLAGRSLEFWNAGVHGYSTAQEVNYYRRFVRPLKPDLVLLLFCLNDFDGTPVIFNDSQEGNVVITPYLGREHYNPWLFRNSVVYRLFLAARIAVDGRVGVKADMRAQLEALRRMGKEDGFRLQVVVYPILDRPESWSANYTEQHRAILEILQGMGIPYVDLRPLLTETLRSQTVAWTRMDGDKDYFHPSEAFSARIAEYLLSRGVLP